MLTSVDLFTGTGGIARALHGIARPLAYCDILPESHAVLGDLMRRGLLPRAPVCDDVRKLTAKWLGGKRVDLIAGGFPCQGFSTLGLMEGFDHAHSSLFFELLRLVGELKPAYVFMENVPAVLVHMRTIVDEFHKRGYDLRWCVLAASAVGAPQYRKRWFCLAVRRSGEHPAIAVRPGEFRAHGPRWRREPVPRMAPGKNGRHGRVAMLGNAVVPDCVRMAWFGLFAGRWAPDAVGRMALAPAPAGKPIGPGGEYPSFGTSVRGVAYAQPRPPVAPWPVPKITVTLDPSAWSKQTGYPATSPRVTEPRTIHAWATPRHGNVGASHLLTERVTRDLATQVRFAADTPAAQRGLALNPEWVEWLMGYPRGWTAAAGGRKMVAHKNEHGDTAAAAAAGARPSDGGVPPPPGQPKKPKKPEPAAARRASHDSRHRRR